MRMYASILTIGLLGWIAQGCQSQEKTMPSTEVHVPKKDSLHSLKHYSSIIHVRTEQITAETGTKSVLFDPTRRGLYAMNLEGMSVAEYDQSSRKLIRTFRFEKTKARGWDYSAKRSIPSWEEKPVEGWMTHGGRMLWVSLHNAAGIVGIRVDSVKHNHASDGSSKRIQVEDSMGRSVPILVPFFKTGETPKVITSDASEKKLLVSNWHSNTISVLDLLPEHPYAKPFKDIRMPAIPRGMVSDPTRKKTYVAIMGGTSLAVIDESNWSMDTILPISGAPRHILQDSSGRLFVSFNTQAQLACLDPTTGKTRFSIATAAQPRTIALSKNQAFVFVTGYSSNKLEVFKITDSRFERVASLNCPGHPVGVDLYEDNDKIEAWVCSYQGGKLHIFSFDKD